MEITTQTAQAPSFSAPIEKKELLEQASFSEKKGSFLGVISMEQVVSTAHGLLAQALEALESRFEGVIPFWSPVSPALKKEETSTAMAHALEEHTPSMQQLSDMAALLASRILADHQEHPRFPQIQAKVEQCIEKMTHAVKTAALYQEASNSLEQKEARHGVLQATQEALKGIRTMKAIQKAQATLEERHGILNLEPLGKRTQTTATPRSLSDASAFLNPNLSSESLRERAESPQESRGSFTPKTDIEIESVEENQSVISEEGYGHYISLEEEDEELQKLEQLMQQIQNISLEPSLFLSPKSIYKNQNTHVSEHATLSEKTRRATF